MSDVATAVEQLQRLVTLQEIDREMGGRLDKKRQLPGEVEAARQQQTTARQQAAQLKTELEAVTKQRRGRDRDLEGQEERLGRLKARVAALKTNKEYQVHLREVEQAAAEKGRLEEEIILLMEQQDVLRRTLTTQDEAVAEATRRCEAEQTRVDREICQLDAALARLTEERLGVVGHVEAALLGEYEELRARSKGLAVAAIERGACMGCRLSLPPQLCAEVRKGEKIQHCINCQRILYSPAHHVVERHAAS